MTEAELLEVIEQAATEGATELDLSGKGLTVLPSEIGKLSQLKTLILGKYKYDEEGEIVDTIGNNLNTLPREIGQLHQLEELQIVDNELATLPPEIEKLTNLRSLNLNSNQLTTLPPEIKKLTNLQSLNLNSNLLSSLPVGIVQLTNLQLLDLSANQLSTLPSEIGFLTNLQALSLISNRLNELPSEFRYLYNLRTLHLSYNQLSELPPEFRQLNNLQLLDLSGNQLSVLPPEIGLLTNLQSLDLSANQLIELTPEFRQLTNLRALSLSYNQLTELPLEIVQLTNLQSLDLSKNQLSELPVEIGLLTNLQALNLYFNQLSELPPEIGLLTNLQALNLYFNQLSELPPEIRCLTNLQSLDLGKNQLSELPIEIVQLTHLQSLYLSANQLSGLPSAFGLLTNLQSLDLNFNQLNALPPEIGRLTQLQSLDLSGNVLSRLPPEIGRLTQLRSLSLSANLLSRLPLEIGLLINLQSLDLNFNQLIELPSEIGLLTQLRSLFLSANLLSKLPSEIRLLINLQSLDLNFNQLSWLPPEIQQLPNLTKLDLRGNPVPIPHKILGPKEGWKDPGDFKEILDFYFHVQDPNATESLYEAKFLIVGEGGAGKTSLAKKIEDENYQLQVDEKSTQGIEVIQWNFQHSDRDFRVNIWDFGGQEIYHETHQFFLTKRSLYALVADTRKEDTDFYWWLKIIELLSDNSPVLIIKNEKQERQCEVNERSLRGEFTNLKEVLATNLETNRGLQDIKDAIKQYIIRLPHVGTPLPKLWVRVRSALENYSRNYISFEEYCQLCQLNNLTEREHILQLSWYLHDLGVFLHFQDDPTLKHYVILKPEWGTTAVYKVLDNETVKKNLGCFTRKDLKHIWKDLEYAEMRDELLRLMMRFKLCYPIPNHSDNYIAPQLLDINRPNYTWDDTNNLILRYEYEFMPKGMLTRFIVETHPWIEEQKLVWRSGVILNKEQTRAEIMERYNQREIKIRVAGNRKKELLAVIAHEFDKIHRSFERLQYRTLVPCNCMECQGSQEPYSYPLDNLHKRLKAKRYKIECEKSYEMVDVRQLIDDVNLQQLGSETELNHKSEQLQQELSHERDKSFQNRKITSQQRKKLHSALISAFTEPSSLERLLDYELDKSLNEIAQESNLDTIVFKLIKTADSQGWLLDLVRVAHQSIPGNSELTVIAEELLKTI